MIEKHGANLGARLKRDIWKSASSQTRIVF